MKLLGQFDQVTGNRYLDFLKEKGVEVEAEIASRDYVSIQGMQRIGIDVKLFVPEEDYKKAEALIKEIDFQISQRVEIETKEANKVMLKIMIGVICVIALTIYFYYFRVK